MVPDASALRERAHLLRTAAADARRIADEAGVVRRLGGVTTWQGPAADRFDERVGAQIGELDDLAERLRRDARRLDALADAIAIG